MRHALGTLGCHTHMQGPVWTAGRPLALQLVCPQQSQGQHTETHTFIQYMSKYTHSCSSSQASRPQWQKSRKPGRPVGAVG